MKDLLKVCPKSNRVIVGLDDRAFVGSLLSSDEASLVELAPTPPFNSVNNNSRQQQKKKASEPENNPVQAVAISNDSTFLWCAVARHDKSLEVYRLDQKDTTQHKDGDNHTTIPVHVTHRTAKRVSALCFGEIPPPTDKSNEQQPLRVVIAADLAGDAVAFSTEPTTSTTNRSSEVQKQKDTDSDNSNDDPMLLGNTRSDRRLLLGHTASMLTSVAVVASQPHQSSSLILTADRDEKIRVSNFPQTHSIRGYLMGNTAFVSSMDVVVADTSYSNNDGAQRCSWCVSFGGDGTLRLWDYVQCRQLATVSTNASIATDTEPRVEDEGKPIPTENDDDKQEEEADNNADDDDDEKKSDGEKPKRPTKPVPSKVAINPRGDRIVTICDDCQKLQLWKVVTIPGKTDDDDKKFEIQPSRTLPCATQPLAASFYGNDQLLALLREPEYLQLYTITTTTATATSDCPLSLELVPNHVFVSQLREIAATTPSIAMPTSVLERDAFGNLKMEKINEQRGNSAMKPWYNAQRKETARERQKRVRKRRRTDCDEKAVSGSNKTPAAGAGEDKEAKQK